MQCRGLEDKSFKALRRWFPRPEQPPSPLLLSYTQPISPTYCKILFPYVAGIWLLAILQLINEDLCCICNKCVLVETWSSFGPHWVLLRWLLSPLWLVSPVWQEEAAEMQNKGGLYCSIGPYHKGFFIKIAERIYTGHVGFRNSEYRIPKYVIFNGLLYWRDKQGIANTYKHFSILPLIRLINKVSYFVTTPACTKTLYQPATRALNSWKAKYSVTPFSQNLALFRLCRCDCWCTSVVFTRGRISALASICSNPPCAHHSEFIIISMYSNCSSHHLWL